MTLDHTNDHSAQSWVASANLPDADFPIQNLAYGAFSVDGGAPRIGVAIGDQVLDVSALAQAALLSGEALTAGQACAQPTLNALMALGPSHWRALRHAVFAGLSSGAPADTQARWQACLLPQASVRLHLAVKVGDYTDFYTSIYHATNIGKLFRPDNPLLPNYTWVPIGYHGRASSLVVSGTPVVRPNGQVMAPGATEPVLKPSQRLDIELELGFYVGQGNALGQPIALDDAPDHVFGVSLLNDWSARDIQAWEYQPLGPFLSKSFCTSLSPWVVPMAALAPVQVPMQRPDDKQDVPYLTSEANRRHGALDIRLEVLIRTPAMRAAGLAPHRICETSYRHAYWTLAQIVTHHTVNGCNLQPGDLLGSGTLSGPTATEAAALIELTQGGKMPLSLPSGETRTFLQDGDEITLNAYAQCAPGLRVGLGQAVDTVAPAPTLA